MFLWYIVKLHKKNKKNRKKIKNIRRKKMFGEIFKITLAVMSVIFSLTALILLVINCRQNYSDKGLVSGLCVSEFLATITFAILLGYTREICYFAPLMIWLPATLDTMGKMARMWKWHILYWARKRSFFIFAYLFDGIWIPTTDLSNNFTDTFVFCSGIWYNILAVR